LYGYDSDGRCRTDYYTPPNGVLDRFASSACCVAYDAAKATAEATAAAEAAKLAAGMVSIKVKKAVNLPDFDPAWLTGHTDAFVQLIVGPQTAATHHVESSANPIWDELLSFDVPASDTDQDLLILEVWDHDSLFNFWYHHDKISDLDIQFRTLTPDQWISYEEDMKTSDGNNAGKIEFEVMWVPSQTLTGTDSTSNEHDVEHNDGCPAAGQDCRSAKCCSDPGMTCYEKDDGWASCMQFCTPGVHSDDPVEYQTPWNCHVLSTTTDSCAQVGASCLDSKCCKDPNLKCYEKDEHWASCKSQCTPGIDTNDPEALQTPWSCDILHPSF
jgi:hypothetical protein